MSRLPAIITTAVIAMGAASIATSARASDPSACRLMAAVAYGADTLRQSGMPQYQAAYALGDIIGNALSDQPGDIRMRQTLASAAGEWGSYILDFVYSRPVKDDAFLRSMSPDIIAEAVWQLCLEGKL